MPGLSVVGGGVRSLRWAGHAALGAALLLNGVFSVVFFHDRMLGGPYWTCTNDSDLLFALTLLPLSAHLLGGFVSARLTRSSPGMSGASSAVLSALVAGVKLLFALSFMLDPAVDPRTRS